MESLFHEEDVKPQMPFLDKLLAGMENLEKNIPVKAYTTPTNFRHNVRDETPNTKKEPEVKRKTF